MDRLSAQLWDPWLATAFVCVAAIVTVALLVPQVRAWKHVRGALRGQPDEDPPPFALLLATSSGMGGIAGSALAMAMAGPGAIVWSWLAIVLGLGLHFLEGVLGSRAPKDTTPPQIHVLGVPLGNVLAPFFAAGVVTVAIVVGGMIQTHEAAAVLELQSGLSPTTIAIAIAVVAAPCVFASGVRRLLFRLVPFALALYAIVAIVVALGDPLLLQLTFGDAVNQAFGVEPALAGAAGGTVGVVLYHGVMRAALGGGTGGLGAAALAGIVADRPIRAGAVAMTAALASAGVLSLATGLVVLGGGSGRAVVGGSELVALEQPHSRGLRPSQQVGQTVVLPADTTMQAKEHYAMLLRANPRGHAWGKLDLERNAVVLFNWKIAWNTNAVAFRTANKNTAAQAAWDVVIPCNREVRDAPDGTSFLKLTPVDENIQLGALITRLALEPTPYVILEDFHFTGRVGEATSPDPALGVHLAMYEPPVADRPFNPKLHEFFRVGYRGPYPDDEQPRPPFAIVANPDFQPEIGQVLRMRMSTGPRGAPAVSVTRSGGVEAPPWSVMLQARELVLRRADDPSRDVHIAVTPRLDGPRVRFDAVDPKYQDIRTTLSEDPKLSGPFVVTPDVELEVEVHGDARLPAALAGHRTLIPVHELGEPAGAPIDGGPIDDPHPGALLQAGYIGPYLAYDGAQIVAARFDTRLGGFGRAAIAIVVVVLAVAAIAAHGELGSRAAMALFGTHGAPLARAGCVIAAACGTIPSRWALLAIAEVALAALLIPSLFGLALSIARARRKLDQRETPP